MEKMYNYIEADSDCQWTLEHLKDIAKTDDDDPVDRTIVLRLRKHYGERILIQRRSYNNTFVLFKDSLYDVLQVNFNDD